MIRMRTKTDNGSVFTIYFMRCWVTFVHYNKKCIHTFEAFNSLMDAGLNHLEGVKKLKELSCQHMSPENKCSQTSE